MQVEDVSESMKLDRAYPGVVDQAAALQESNEILDDVVGLHQPVSVAVGVGVGASEEAITIPAHVFLDHSAPGDLQRIS